MEVFSQVDRGVDSEKFCLVGRYVCYVAEDGLRYGLILSSTVQNNCLPLLVAVDTSCLNEGHWNFLLQKKIVAAVDDLFKRRLELLIFVAHVGSPVDDYRVLSLLVDIDICHACRLFLENSPVQLHATCLHLRLETTHGIVVSHLSDEMAGSLKFCNSNCLVGPLSSVGSEVAVGLKSLPSGWNVLDVEKVVSIRASKYTNLLLSFHQYLYKTLSSVLMREC